MKNIKYLLCAILLIVGELININTYSILAEQPEIIRVGFPEFPGLSEINEEGQYEGLVYEYLLEISKYTGWQYDIVEGTPSELLTQLEDGDIDLMGGMNYSEELEKIFEYPAYRSGATYSTLSVPKNVYTIKNSDFGTFQDIRIGVRTSAKGRIANLESYLQANGIRYTLKYYDDRESHNKALENNEVDALLLGDLVKDSELRIVARFAEQPYYFATTKGNTELINKLNYALEKIFNDSPNYDRVLYNKYFTVEDCKTFNLTEDEENFIKNNPILKVGIVPNFEPISYRDNRTQEFLGVSAKIFDMISEKTGLQFKFIEADSYPELIELMKDNKIDLITSVVRGNYYLQEDSMILSKPYMTSNVIVAENKTGNPDKMPIVALSQSYGMIDPKLPREYIYKYYDTVEECLEAVDKGEATTTFMNMHTYSALSKIKHYSHFTDTYMGHFNEEISIGINRSLDPRLIVIVNKAIHSMEGSELELMISESRQEYKRPRGFDAIVRENPFPLITIISISMLMIIGILSWLFCSKIKAHRLERNVLLKKSSIDGLTRILNRETGEDAIKTALKQVKEGCFGALHVMDVDFFKQINDQLGHGYGDQVLVQLADALVQVYSPKNIVCRWGGDEFIVFVKSCYNEDEIKQKAMQLLKLMDKTLRYKEKEVPVSISIGIVLSDGQIAFDELYKNADEALYQSKERGRNTFTIWQE